MFVALIFAIVVFLVIILVLKDIGGKDFTISGDRSENSRQHEYRMGDEPRTDYEGKNSPGGYHRTINESQGNYRTINDSFRNESSSKEESRDYHTKNGFSTNHKTDKDHRRSDSANSMRFRRFLMDDEEVIAVLGENYLERLLTGAGLSKACLILTSKRLYVKGNFFVKQPSGNFSMIKQDTTIRDETITGHTIIHNTSLTPLIGIIIGSIICILGFLARNIAPASKFISITPSFLLYVIGVMINLVSIIKFFSQSGDILTIDYHGNTIGVGLRWYNHWEIERFTKSLNEITDLRANYYSKQFHKEEKTPPPNPSVDESQKMSKIDRLIQLKSMYDKGLISDEEFNTFKAQL